MKALKKLLAIAMIMVLAMSVCGCANTAEQLYGSWEMTVDLSEEVESELNEPEFHETLDVKLIMEFNEDGTLRMYADKEFTTDSLNNWLNAYLEFVLEETYVEYEESGWTREEVDQAMQEQYGMGVREMLEDAMAESVSVDDIVADLETTGVWDAKGDKLYIDEYEVQANCYDNFKVEGDTLTISMPEGAEASTQMMEGFDYPFILTRVAE